MAVSLASSETAEPGSGFALILAVGATLTLLATVGAGFLLYCWQRREGGGVKQGFQRGTNLDLDDDYALPVASDGPLQTGAPYGRGGKSASGALQLSKGPRLGSSRKPSKIASRRTELLNLSLLDEEGESILDDDGSCVGSSVINAARNVRSGKCGARLPAHACHAGITSHLVDVSLQPPDLPDSPDSPSSMASTQSKGKKVSARSRVYSKRFSPGDSSGGSGAGGVRSSRL